MDNIITPRNEATVKSMNALCGRDVVSVTAISELGKQVGISVLYENVFDRNSTFRQLSLTDETRGYYPDEVSYFPVSETRFDRQPHSHRNKLGMR